jgi:hypothetical protein
LPVPDRTFAFTSPLTDVDPVAPEYIPPDVELDAPTPVVGRLRVTTPVLGVRVTPAEALVVAPAAGGMIPAFKVASMPEETEPDAPAVEPAVVDAPMTPVARLV